MTILEQLSAPLRRIFEEMGCPPELGDVRVSDRPDLADFQCNGALQASKLLKKNPREIAESLVTALKADAAAGEMFRDISIAGPGFLNFKIQPAFLAASAAGLLKQTHYGLGETGKGETVILDFGGPNIAKAMHVGHIRTTVIGDSLQKFAVLLGYNKISDVHLGDWGLPMGMLICEVKRRQPDLPYFDDSHNGPYPEESPVSIDELAEMYPHAAQRAKEDEDARNEAREATRLLQEGHAGYTALWQHFFNVSIAAVRQNFADLNVYFDLYLGESHTQPVMDKMLADLKTRRIAVEDQGAWIIPVAEESDKNPVPPLMLINSEGGLTYMTTDLATIYQRQQEFKPDKMLYVVDQRQALHFLQVFRAARKAGYVPDSTELLHLGYGTINGPDGKPFKTRDGGVMTLNGMIAMVIQRAEERLRESGVLEKFPEIDIEKTARQIGLAAIRFADLSNHRTSDYIFDIERFTSFEGKTGPYLQYTAVRLKSLMEKAAAAGLNATDISGDESSTPILLDIALFPQIILDTWQAYQPSILCEYLFQLAQKINTFYQKYPVLNEENKTLAASRLALIQSAVKVLTDGLALLGIDVPEKM